MLDVRPIAYITPVAEQPIGPITPVVHIISAGDEACRLTGLFRIYRKTTDQLLYTSELPVIVLPGNTTADVAALTPWNPPAPADDDYFILCDTLAANDLVPDGYAGHLGAYTFDVKTIPMGPIPGGHHTTHELGGMDEISLTGMTGLLATAQTPISHALEHEAGGSDPLDVTNLPGILAQPQPPAAHGNTAHTSVFEDQANKGAAGGYCELPNPLDSTLPLRADGKAAHTLGYFQAIDFSAAVYHPWVAAAILSGAVGTDIGSANHPGVRSLQSSTTPNSGGSVLTTSSSLLLAGNESSNIIIRPMLLAGTTLRAGYHDATTATDAVDGCYFEMAQLSGVNGTLVGKTANNSARSVTTTNLVLITTTWYRLRVTLDPTAARVDFYLYAADGTLLWTDNLTTNIPTTTGRETGHGIICTNSGSSAQTLALVDYMDNYIGRVFVR
jgi:hypothetical protein